MRAIGDEMGFQYFVFLETHLGLDPSSMQKKQKELGVTYHYDADTVKTFYREAGAACRKLSYCLDISAELLGRNELFRDVLHRTPAGQKIEAARIFEALKKRGAFAKPRKGK